MSLNIQENVPLTDYSTMCLGGPARYLVQIASNEALVEAVAWAREKDLKQIMIGGGANLIFRDEGFDGLVLVNCIEGLSLSGEGGDIKVLTAGAGEIWDDVVAYSVDRGLSGLESLSLIPGKTGAAAVQNIGAYGQEVAQTLVSVEAYDTQTDEFVTLGNADCNFAYRASRFNRADKGRYFITALTFKLDTIMPEPPYYKDVEKYLQENPVHPVTPAVIRDAVIQIRSRKLPDPAKVANSGSFFYNPIITREEFDKLAAKHPELNETPSSWPQPPRWFLPDGGVKLSAGRLIELAGFKATKDEETGMALWPKQNLVLINEHACSTADLLAFKAKIVTAVKARFDIELQQEPELI